MIARRIICHIVWGGLLILGVVLPGCQSASEGLFGNPFEGSVPNQWEPPVVEGQIDE